MTRNDYGSGYGFGRSNGRGMGGRGNGQCRRDGSGFGRGFGRGFGPGTGFGAGQGRRCRVEEADGQSGFNIRNRISAPPFAAAIARIEAAIEDLKRQINDLRQKP